MSKRTGAEIQQWIDGKEIAMQNIRTGVKHAMDDGLLIDSEQFERLIVTQEACHKAMMLARYAKNIGESRNLDKVTALEKAAAIMVDEDRDSLRRVRSVFSRSTSVLHNLMEDVAVQVNAQFVRFMEGRI